ncbi:MAG TPA: ATP-binding protein [Mucilaginibacter sp.]
MIWTNVLLFKHGVNIVTVQLTILVLSGGYYILGVKWGAIYSFLNILPIIGFVIIDTYANVTLASQQLNINNNAFAITLIFNYLLLLYIHFSFFKAYQIANTTERELKESLQKAVVAAQELAAAKTNFLSTMSHELRTPLNAVVGMTNILLMENPRQEQMENLDILRFSAENLMSTVNDILDFNKIDNDKVALEEHVFKPMELINNVHGAFKAIAKDKQIQFDYQIDPDLMNLKVKGDQLRLTQILFNLVGNAIKFTSKGFVILEGKIVKKDSENVSLLFKIEDTGIGIPEDRIAMIFDPFTQVLSRTNRQYHGSGLGLTIAYRLVKLHGAELNLSSTEGKGTVFSFKFQYALVSEEKQEQIKMTKIAGNSLDKLRVLLAEDEPVNILVLKKLLGKWGIIPDVAVNGSEAVNAVIKNKYDVILMDINMPVMDGFEAAKQIRELKDNPNSAIPIIAVTASIGAAIEQISTYQYIDDCILKPFKPEHLKEKLEQIVTNHL